MGTFLERFLADNPPPVPAMIPFIKQAREKHASATNALPDQQGVVGRLPLEAMSTYIPLSSRAFFRNLGQGTTAFKDLPPYLLAEMAQNAPATDRLPVDFNYKRLAEVAERGRDSLKPEVYFKLASVAAIGQARQDAAGAKRALDITYVGSREAIRQATFGLIPGVEEEELGQLSLTPQGVGVAKAIGSIAGIAMAGKLVVTALSKTTMLPKLGPAILKLPQRAKEVMLGVGTGAILDAARPDGLPEDPAAIDISARLAHPIANVLGDSEAAQRVALGVSGGVVGGAIGEILLPVFRGIRNAREARLANSVPPEMMAVIKERLQAAGVGVESGETNKAVLAKLLRNYDKVSQSERLAQVTAADETRMDYILGQLYSDPGFQGNSDLRYMAGVFRANPGGVSVAHGVEHTPQAAEELTKRMGLNVVTIKAGNDVIILRPQVVLPEPPKVSSRLQRQLEDFADQVRSLGRGKPSTRMAILPNGTVVRGDYQAAEMVSRYKLTVPKVGETAFPETAVREHFNLMDVQVGEGNIVTVNLPSRVTPRQVAMLGRMADRGIPQMVLNSATPGVSTTLQQPFGMQVEDAMYGLIKGASKPKITADVVRRVEQYRSEGVFQGQAGVLPDGYPVEIMRKVGKKVLYRDPITGLLHRTPVDNITVLPTSLEGEFLPSRQIFEALEPAERTAFAALRRGINEGLAKPITTVRDLESFASTRGKLVTPIGKGRIRVYDQNTGESKVYDSIRSATTGVRGSLGPLPDLTPPEIEELLGYKPNLGALGNNGPPARFGEYVPITEDEFAKAATNSTLGMLPPGAVEQFFVPTRGLMEDLTVKYNMPFDKVFANLQSGVVHRQNFVSAWVNGEGPGLPEDLMPLGKIFKLAGKPDDGRQRLFTAWLESESDDVARKAIEAQMRPNEIKAVQELRKWYGLGPENGLFKALGVEAEYLTSYAPHLREHAEGIGNNLVEAWRISKGTPLPKSVEWAADFARDGTLNVYEDRAFVAAARYVEMGARSRYLNQAMDDAKRILRAIPDNAVKPLLVNYLEALRGSEFVAQRASLDASFVNLLRSLGASERLSTDVGERMTLWMLGLSYQSTMGFRPGLAIRNMAQIFQTTWPLVGGLDDSFAEAIGRAMTQEGRNAAIRSGAISIKQNAVFAGEEAAELMPAWLRKMNDAGFRLYDTADSFTRSVSFHAGKIKAERAIAQFGKDLAAGKSVETAQRALVRDSGAMVLSPRFKDEFLRRVATSPEGAGDFIGKQIADITQFLYGRGNQPRWMRTVPGRFFGQFGTWPLWYIDYLRRSFLNMWGNGYQAEAVKFLGKIALVDAAIYEGGRRANLDLRRWMAGNALFGVPPLGRSPATSVLFGIQDLVRGTSEEVLSTYESPANKQRLGNARQVLQDAGLAFIPGTYAVRDIGRLFSATTPTEVAAAMLAVRPSTEYTVQQRLDMLFAPGKLSTDIELEEKGDTTPTAVEIMLKGMQMGGRERLIVPQGNLPPQPPGMTPLPQGTPGEKSSLRIRTSVSGRPPMEPTALPESIRSGESKPIQ